MFLLILLLVELHSYFLRVCFVLILNWKLFNAGKTSKNKKKNIWMTILFLWAYNLLMSKIHEYFHLISMKISSIVCSRHLRSEKKANNSPANMGKKSINHKHKLSLSEIIYIYISMCTSLCTYYLLKLCSIRTDYVCVSMGLSTLLL